MNTPYPIVCVAEADYDTTTWLNVQPLMTRFARAGHPVLYVESLGLRLPNLGHASDLKKIFRRLRRLSEGLRERIPNLWLLAPLAFPGHHIGFIQRLNRYLLRRQLRKAMTRLKMTSPVLWVYLPSGEPIIGALGERLVMYHCVDDYLANPGVPAAELKVMEDRIVEKAGAVMVTAPSLLKKFEKKARNLICIPNGADSSAFEFPTSRIEPDDIRNIPHPRIGFSGNLTAYKLDFELLAAVITARPQWHFVFIGQFGGGDPSTPLPGFLKLPNVHWLGEKPYKALPAYLMHWDAGIIPYRMTAATKAVFPIKFFEYLAAGLPIVGTPLPSLSGYSEFYSAAGNPVAFTVALDQALKSPPSARNDRQILAAKNSWDARYDEISNYIQNVLNERSHV